jgi:peptide/nickel transport system permease protein
LIASGIALFIGVIVGGLMGYFSGIVDMLGMRLVEIFEDIPTLFLLLTFVAFFGRSLYMMMVIIGITGWSGYARYVRQEFLKLRKQDYVQAAVASGLPLSSILFRHMLPNGIAPLLVAVSFGVAGAILSEATLSFLGLGVVDAPSWGQMLDQAVKSSTFNWWMAVFPGGAIFMTVFAYNLIGEAFRDAIDPKLASKAGHS